MDTGVVIIQEPVFTKTSVEEAPAGVLDHSTMEVDKANLSTALDDCRNSIVSVESKHEKEEAMKTIPVVEDSKVVKEKDSETETDEQGSTYVHEPESFSKNTNDANIILSHATSEKEKEDDSTQKLEEVIFEKPVTEEDQTETKHLQEQEKDISNISKVLVDTAPVKSGEDDIEKSLDSAREEIPIKTDEVKEVKDSRTVESSVNGTETEHKATVSVEEISRNGENLVKETALEEEPLRDGVSLHDVETTKGVLETEKEAEPKLDTKEKDETETVNTIVKDPEIVNTEETIVHESIGLKENAEPVEAIKNSDDAEQISREVTGDREKEEDIIQKAEEVEESLTVTETPTKQGEDIEPEVSKETEEHEHVLVRDIPQDETLVPKAETVNTSTVQESAILKTLETKSDETDAESILDVKEKEETVKTVTSSDEMQESITVIEPPKTSPDQRSKDTEEDEHVLGRNMPQGEIFVTEAESLVTQEDTEPIMDLKEDKEQEKTEKFEEVPSDLALKVDKEELKNELIEVDQVVGAQAMERGLESNESEAEQIDRNRTDETEESPVEKLVVHPDVESVEQMEKPSHESPSEVSEETSKTLDEKIEEKPEVEVPQHQEGQEEGSYGSETKEETVSVPESSELGEKTQERSLDLTPLQEESCLAIEKDKEETKLQKEEVHKHEPANEEVKSDEVIEVSSASPSEEREGETVVEAKIIEEIKETDEEQVADKIQRSLETDETVDTEPVKSNEDDIEESLSSVNEEKDSRTVESSVNGTEDEHNATVSVEGISKNSENTVHETSPEEIKNSDEAEEISHDVTGDIEKEEDITRKTEEVEESPTVIETQIIQEEKIESKASKDTEEHEHALVRDMPQIDTLVTEAEDVKTSTVQEVETSKTLETTTNETEVGEETKEDIEPSLDLKEDKEKEETETATTVISSDEERPSDQVDVQAEESVEVKSKETLQDKINEDKHENLLDVSSGELEKFQVNEPETVLVDKTEVDKVDGTQVLGEQRGLEPNEPEAEQIDRKKPDEEVETPVVESVEKMQSSSLECPSEVSEETITTVDEKIEEKLQEEKVTLQQEGQEKASCGLEIKEETLSVPESSELGEVAQEEASCLPKETELQQEEIEKYEAPNNQQSPVEQKSDEVIQVSSASPSEEREDEIVVDAVKLEDIKANEKEQVAEKSQKSLEPLEIAEPQSLFPSCSEKTEDERVKEEEPSVQILCEEDATKGLKTQDEVHKTVETTAVQEEHTRDIGSSLNEKCSMDQTLAEESQVNDKVDELVDSQASPVFSEKSDNETLTADAKKGNVETTVSDTQQGETIVIEADHEAVDTSTVQEAAVLNTLETTINDSETVHSSIGGEEESQVTKEVTEPSLDVKEDKKQEETETVKTVILSDEVIKDENQGREESVEVKPKEIVQHESTQEKDENLLDIPSGESAEKLQRPSIESPSELSEETIKTVDEKVEEKPEEEVTLHQESQETKEETDPVPVPESSELVVQAKEEESSPPKEQEKELEEESSPPKEQEKEITLQKEKIEKHESTSEEDTNAHETPVEEKSDEVVQVSSASPSEERKGKTLVEAEKIEDIIKANEEEQVADKMQRSIETVETDEPHSSFPSPPEEHETVPEAFEKIEDGKVKETEPMGDMSDKGLEISETKDLSLPLEAAGSDGTESSELAAESEEQKPKQVKEILEGEKLEVDETKAEELPSSETTPQEILSDVVAVQLKREDNATESNERQEELSKDKEMEETKVAQEEQTRDIGTSLTEPEEQVNEKSTRDEQEKVSSTEKGETKSKELEEQNIDERVDSSEKNDQETLVAETTKEDEDKIVSLDGSGASKTSENVCIKQDEFETLEAPKLEESKENKSQEISETIEAIEPKGDQTPSFISELEDQIPKQIEEIHEETKEEPSLEKSQEDQTPSLVSEQVEEIHEEEEEEETKESHKVEATSGQDLPVETSQAHQTPSTKSVSELDDKTPKPIEEIHEEETKEDQSLEKSQDDQTPSLSSEQVEEIHEEEEEEEETKESHKVEATSGQDLPVETSQAHQTPSTKSVSELDNKTPKPIEEIHEEETKEDQSLEKSQDDQTPSLSSEQVEEIHEEEEEEEETKESHKVEATSGQDLPVETSQAHQTPSTKSVSELDNKTPKPIEEIHEEETKEDQSLEKSQDDQTPSLSSEQVEEIHEEEEEEETKESHKVEAMSGQDLPVETSQAHQTPSSKFVSELDEKIPKQIEEIHEEETKSHKLQEEEVLPTKTVPREVLSEAPVSMLAFGEDDQVTVQESNYAGDTQEKEESVGETEPKESEPKESEPERTEKLDDKVTMVEDEDTKKTDVEVAETTKEQSMMTRAPENACLEQEELKDLETLQHGEIIEGTDSLKNDNSDDFTFSTETGEAEHVDETSSTLPVVGILKELQTTLEESERAVNNSEAESCGIDLHTIKAEPETLEKNLFVEESPVSEIIEANMLQQDEHGGTEKIQEENGLADKSLPIEELKLQEEHKEEGKVQDNISREFEVDAEEKLQEETREIAEFKEETPSDQSLKEVVPAEKTPLPSEELEHVASSEKQVEHEPQQDINASPSVKISLKEEDTTDFETSKDQNAKTHVIVKEEDQIVDIQEEKKNEVRDEKLSGLSATRDTEETFSSEVKKDQEDESELGAGHDSATLQVEKEEEAHSVLGNDHEINEVVTPEKQMADPMGVVKKASEAEHESNEEHIESQAISDDTKSNNDRDFPTEEAPKDQREDVNANTFSTKEAFDVQVKPEVPVTDKDTTEQEKNDHIYVQEDIGTNVKPEVRDSVVAQKEETSLIEEKSEVDYVNTEPEDAISHGNSTEEKHKASEKIDEEATKEIYQEESKQTDIVAAIKDEIKEEEKETTHESFNTKKNTDDATEKTKPEILEIKNSSPISDTQDKTSKEMEEPKKKDEVPNQQKREIADEVPKLESLKTAEELQQRDGETEPTVKESARKSLSDLIQKVKVTDKTEVATTEPGIEEEAKAEEQDEDGEEHKDDKTSPDSIVMVEAKDTVSIIKTHKKSQGILSGVGSKVKHSISKVKKALTGKSSHTTKPSSPQ